jgi:hypothetical protein
MYIPAYNDDILFITVGLRSSINVKDQVSLHPHKTEFRRSEPLRFYRIGREDKGSSAEP